MATEPEASTKRLMRVATEYATYKLLEHLNAVAVGLTGITGEAEHNAWAASCNNAIRNTFTVRIRGGQQDTDPSVLLVYCEHIDNNRPVPFITAIRYLSRTFRAWDILQFDEGPLDGYTLTRVKLRVRPRSESDFSDGGVLNFDKRFNFLRKTYTETSQQDLSKCAFTGIRF